MLKITWKCFDVFKSTGSFSCNMKRVICFCVGRKNIWNCSIFVYSTILKTCSIFCYFNNATTFIEHFLLCGNTSNCNNCIATRLKTFNLILVCRGKRIKFLMILYAIMVLCGHPTILFIWTGYVVSSSMEILQNFHPSLYLLSIQSNGFSFVFRVVVVSKCSLVCDWTTWPTLQYVIHVKPPQSLKWKRTLTI